MVTFTISIVALQILGNAPSPVGASDLLSGDRPQMRLAQQSNDQPTQRGNNDSTAQPQKDQPASSPSPTPPSTGAAPGSAPAVQSRGMTRSAPSITGNPTVPPPR
jgi:hypothetical protein